MVRKKVGIIGGVGPLATMFLGETIVRLTNAKTDQEHVHTIITNDTSIPDRTAFILNNKLENPVPYLQRAANVLTTAGAELIIMPCNTAHTFYSELAATTNVPIINMIEETANAVGTIKRVGVLATDGTLASQVYQNALAKIGVASIVPSPYIQRLVMSIIYDKVKAGQVVTAADWQPIETEMRSLGCERIILGCTELSIVNRDLRLNETYIDSLVVLATCAIEQSGYEVKKMNTKVQV